MTYKDILVYLDGSFESEALARHALRFSKAFGARLTAVDVDGPEAFDSEWANRAKALETTFKEIASGWA